MKLLSWNVNGVRAALGKGLLDWMNASKADVISLQEVKATAGDVQGVAWPKGYELVWNAAQKKGYSGTALFSRKKPLSVSLGLGSPEHDFTPLRVADDVARHLGDRRRDQRPVRVGEAELRAQLTPLLARRHDVALALDQDASRHDWADARGL